MPIDLGFLDANGLYADAVSEYETGRSSYDELVTLALRLSLVLRVAGLFDPGATNAFTEKTLTLSLKDKETGKSVLRHNHEQSENDPSDNHCAYAITDNASIHANAGGDSASVDDNLAVLNTVLFQVLKLNDQNIIAENVLSVHLKIPTNWLIKDILMQNMNDYPIDNQFSTNIDSGKYPITSFVLYTSGTFDRRACLRVYTTFPDIMSSDFNFGQILDFMKRHTNELVKIKAFRRLEKENLTIHMHDDYTILKNQSTTCFYASKLLQREVYQNLSIITSLHTTSTHNNHAVNYTEYSGHKVKISGSKHPVYIVKGFAFDITRLESTGTTWSAEQLMDQSYVSGSLDLTV